MRSVHTHAFNGVPNNNNKASIPSVPITFVFAPVHDGPQRAAFHRSCSASQAATTALVVATRAAVDRCGPGHVHSPLSPTGTADGHGGGGGARGKARRATATEASPAGALQPVRRRARREASLPAWQSRRSHSSAFSGTPWSSLLTSLPWYRFSMILCRSLGTSWWTP